MRSNPPPSTPDLFGHSAERQKNTFAPLAERMRPRNFDEFIGQEDLVGEGKPLRVLIEQDTVPSMIFWGPPGSGKTTLAKLIATLSNAHYRELSAVMSGVQEIRFAVKEAESQRNYYHRHSILFIDEIHRFNKAQQDALLPYVESGVITLIGATTENPSFEVISALLSRCRVFTLSRLNELQMEKIIKDAIHDPERGLGKLPLDIPSEVMHELVVVADGDARHALNALELCVKATPPQADKKIILSIKQLHQALQRTHLRYDKNGEEHYNIISALHKSLRGSDVDAALYWMARMLEAGEDPLYIARRLVRFASEDIGMADPNALVQGVAAFQACHQIGVPECNVILAQLVVYLAQAPKSNSLYTAYAEAAQDVHRLPNEPVPLHIRNAPTKLMKNLGYGKGYQYNPSTKGEVEQSYLPERLQEKVYWKFKVKPPEKKRKE